MATQRSPLSPPPVSGLIPVEITAHVQSNPSHSAMLRLITCGSVDDGKSTLIGRLLYDTKSIYEDQLEAIQRTSLKRGDARVDLALLTDGLRAEREQGITIDVAYRYFSTPSRTFILADTPGHVQYTRNMVTGASTADVAIILIDARQGVLEQTRRHAFLAAMLGVSHLVVCVNKMDLVGFDRAVFNQIRQAFTELSTATDVGGELAPSVFSSTETQFIPMSALLGDNIVNRSTSMPWYDGPTLLEYIERVPARPLVDFPAARLPVQWVIRPQDDAHHDHRAFAGMIASGTLQVGDELVALPSNRRSRIKVIRIGEAVLARASAGTSVAVELEDDLDASRGELLCSVDHPAMVATAVNAVLIWMSELPLAPSRRYVIKHGTRYIKAQISPPKCKLDIHTLRSLPAGGSPIGLGLNDIAAVQLRLAEPIAFDAYHSCRGTGSFIVIDEATNDTVGAGLIVA